MEKRLIMLKKDINVYFKKNDVVEILEVDERSRLVLVYSKKHKKRQWMMFSDVM